MRVRRLIATAGLGLALAAMASVADPVVVAAAGCPSQPLTVDELLGLWDNGAAAGFMGLVNVNGRRCYGDSNLTVIGYVDAPEGLGGTSATVIKPMWLTEWGLMLAPSPTA